MEKEKNYKTSTKIYIIIIILLISALVGMYYYYNTNRLHKPIRKESISTQQVKDYLNTKGFAIEDANSYLDDDSILKEALKNGIITQNNNSNDFRINFFEINDENHAMYSYYDEILRIEKDNNGEFVENYESGDNYLRYTALTNGYYIVMSKVDNTVLFGKIKSSEKETLDSMLEELKY